MKKRAATSLVAGLYSILLGSPALAQQTPSNPAIATAATVELCAIPYTVGEALKGGEMEARFGNAALEKLAKVPGISGKAGAEVVKSAYAGISSQAMSSVLDAYRCRIKSYMTKSGTPEADAKLKEVDRAIARLKIEMAIIQNAAAIGPEALIPLKDSYLDTETRSEKAPVLDAAITSAALADIDPTKLFLSKDTRKIWVGLNIGPNIGVQACGGIVHAAIADGGSSLQVSLASVQSILVNYLDPNTSPSIGLASLFVAASPLPGKTPPDTATFKECISKI